MTAESVLSALRAHDRGLLRRPPVATPGLVADLDRALPQLDNDSRMLGVQYLLHANPPGTGNLLLKMTGDRNLQVAATAAKGLNKITDVPSGEAILAALPSRPDSFVRRQLYLAAGRSQSPAGLESLRTVAKGERDPEAALDAQVAAVKLGGDPERKAFLERIKRARADHAIRIQEQLLYVGDRKLAKGLAPWFTEDEGVMRLGSDRQGGMVRLCDMAVWIAFQLGVPFPMQPAHLTNFSESVIDAAKAAVEALPD